VFQMGDHDYDRNLLPAKSLAEQLIILARVVCDPRSCNEYEEVESIPRRQILDHFEQLCYSFHGWHPPVNGLVEAVVSYMTMSYFSRFPSYAVFSKVHPIASLEARETSLPRNMLMTELFPTPDSPKTMTLFFCS
jgi:hypothetical protein